MNSVSWQDFFIEKVRNAAPQIRIKRVDREHVYLNSCLYKAPHITRKKSRHLIRKLIGKYCQAQF